MDTKAAQIEWRSGVPVPKENGYYAVSGGFAWPKGYPPFEIWHWGRRPAYTPSLPISEWPWGEWGWESHDWQTGQEHTQDEFPAGVRWIEIDPPVGGN